MKLRKQLWTTLGNQKTDVYNFYSLNDIKRPGTI